jgi:hypothetical protein
LFPRLATVDSPPIEPSVLPSLSRRRFLIGSASIAVAASLPAALMAAISEQANPLKRSNPSKGENT